MITTTDVMRAIQEAASAIDEIKRICIGRAPKGFKRPSLQIQPVTTNWADGNKRLVDTTEYFTLTIHIETDDYGNTAVDPLIDLQGKVMRLFRRGYLSVGGRALRVQAGTGGCDPDKAYVDVQFEYFEIRDDTPDKAPLMEQVSINYD